MSTFYFFKLLQENSEECEFEIGQDKYCQEYAGYYVRLSDKPGDYMKLCEKHLAEVYRREMGKTMSRYVDKDARIAALEAENTALKALLVEIYNNTLPYDIGNGVWDKLIATLAEAGLMEER